MDGHSAAAMEGAFAVPVKRLRPARAVRPENLTDRTPTKANDQTQVRAKKKGPSKDEPPKQPPNPGGG